MVRLARALWPSLRPGEPAPAEDGAVVRAALDEIAAVHRRPDELLRFCRDELGRVEAFCRERGLVELPEEPLAIEWTPVFLGPARGDAQSPGPLDRGCGATST